MKKFSVILMTLAFLISGFSVAASAHQGTTSTLVAKGKGKKCRCAKFAKKRKCAKFGKTKKGKKVCKKFAKVKKCVKWNKHCKKKG